MPYIQSYPSTFEPTSLFGFFHLPENALFGFRNIKLMHFWVLMMINIVDGYEERCSYIILFSLLNNILKANILTDFTIMFTALIYPTLVQIFWGSNSREGKLQ